MKQSRNTISDWLDKYRDPKIDKQVEKELEEIIIKHQREMSEDYDPYCKVCGGCGEDGCCPAIACKQSPDGKYCETYLQELQFAYRMFGPLYDMICNDPKYKDSVDMLFDQMYNKTFKTKLQIAYRMFGPLYDMIHDDPKYKDSVEMLFDQMYNRTFNTKEK